MSLQGRAPCRLIVIAMLSVASYGFLWLYAKPLAFAGSNSDFACFYRAGRMVIAGDGAHIYDLGAEHRYDHALGTEATEPAGRRVSLPFVFAPFVLVVFAPLSLLSLRSAELTWYVANAGLLMILSLPAWRRLAHRGAAAAIVMLAPTLFLPAILALMQGQPIVLLLLLFSLTYENLANGQEQRAGFWLALTSFKPQFVLPMLLALVVWRKWKTLRAFALACGGLIAISVWSVGWRATLSYPFALVQFGKLASGPGGEHPQSMPNLRGALYILFHSQASITTLSKIAAAISIGILILMILLLRRHRKVSACSFAFVLVVTLMISYHSYLHDETLLLLPIYLLGQLDRRKGNTLNLSTAILIAFIFILPWAPTSLSTPALQVFAATSIFAILLGLRMYQEDRWSNQQTARNENLPASNRLLVIS